MAGGWSGLLGSMIRACRDDSTPALVNDGRPGGRRVGRLGGGGQPAPVWEAGAGIPVVSKPQNPPLSKHFPLCQQSLCSPPGPFNSSTREASDSEGLASRGTGDRGSGKH